MKVLITGINGFVGRILKQSLLDKGYDVYGVDVVSAGDSRVQNIDITNIDAVSTYILKLKPDYIFHLAAISFAAHKDADAIYRINVFGTANLLNAAAKLENKPGFCLISSCQVYGIVDCAKQPIDETCKVNPVNHYGASKAAAENIALGYFHETGLPVVIARPFNHIGIGQDIKFVVPKLIKAYKDKVLNLSIGNINTIRDFLDVRDVVDAYIALMKKSAHGEIYNICSGKGYSIKEIISLLEEITNHKIDMQVTESLMRKNEIIYAVGDNSKIKKHIGWEQLYNLKETFEWMIS